ncbi:EAL and HDOD domain-containing protein [Halomonas sp. E14]|uniref:EAL and HDOD domain-containing protein n=1 Tax=Halomonas sp. E14 TaxID=3397245 RepID=UPI00403EF5AA
MPAHSEPATFTIALYPIHDAQHGHVADQLLYRSGASSDEPLEATAKALASTVYELGDAGLLGSRSLFVTLPLAWLDRPELLPTPAPRLAIAVAELSDINEALLLRLDDLRERGYRIIMPCSLFNEHAKALWSRTDIVTLTGSSPFNETLHQQLSSSHIKLYAEDVRSMEELAHCQAIGCQLFNARYLTRPQVIATTSRGKHGNRAAQIRLVRSLYEEDDDLQRLQALVLQVPHLHVAILRRANSAFFNRGGTVTDLQRAVQVLGLIELRRLILTLTLANLQPTSLLLLRTALTRAYMCRNLAAPFPALNPDDAFNTGLFSLMDALLEEERDTLLAQIPLPPTVMAALTERTGPLGALLQLCENHENQLAAGEDEVAADQLHRCYLDALVSTQSLLGALA